MQVKDLTINELKILIRETVTEVIEDILADRDEGMTVQQELKQELLEIRKRRKAGTRGISATEVMSRFGLGA